MVCPREKLKFSRFQRFFWYVGTMINTFSELFFCQNYVLFNIIIETYNLKNKEKEFG